MNGRLRPLVAGDARCVVEPEHGGRLGSLVIADREYLAYAGDGPVFWGAFLMAPWCGRLRDDAFSVDGRRFVMPVTYEDRALHGTVVETAFDVVEAGDRDMVLTAPLGPTWPWPGSVTVAYRLREDHLAIELEVAANETAFPAACGIHPWFVRRPSDAPEQARIDLQGTQMLERRPDYTFTGRRVPGPDGPAPDGVDDAFDVPARRLSVDWPGEFTLTVESSSPWFVVYTGRPGAVCVEPQSAPPDSPNDPLGEGVEYAEPGRPVRLETTWRW